MGVTAPALPIGDDGEHIIVYPIMASLNNLYGRPGEAVPVVDVADITALWNLYRDARSRHSGNVAFGAGVLEQVCGPGANIGAVSYRLWMLCLLERIATSGEVEDWQKRFKPLEQDEQFREAAFKVVARAPLKWLEVGVRTEGLPFDMDAFFEGVQRELPGGLAGIEGQS